MTYEEDSNDSEEHDGSTLPNTLIRSVEGGFSFDDTSLLLFESQKSLKLDLVLVPRMPCRVSR